jgi:ribonuclease HI
MQRGLFDDLSEPTVDVDLVVRGVVRPTVLTQGPSSDEFSRVSETVSTTATTSTLVVATDGSALGNPGPGGWAWFVDSTSWASGGKSRTTNNIMELTAVWDLLCCIDRDIKLEILADSRYVIDALTKWVWGWKKRGWKTAKGDPVANRELIEDIHNAMSGRDISFTWVRGHNGHPLNESADVRARGAAELAKKGEPQRCGPVS